MTKYYMTIWFAVHNQARLTIESGHTSSTGPEFNHSGLHRREAPPLERISDKVGDNGNAHSEDLYAAFVPNADGVLAGIEEGEGAQSAARVTNDYQDYPPRTIYESQTDHNYSDTTEV